MTDDGIKCNVTIKLFGSIRYVAGTEKIDIEFPSGGTVYQLLRFFADTYGKKIGGELFLPDGTGLREDLTVIVNGAITERSKVLTTIIDDSAVVALLPVFPGGG